jgi:hypothetical protein
MINLFWWGGGTENKGIKWLAWDRMIYPKTIRSHWILLNDGRDGSHLVASTSGESYMLTEADLDVTGRWWRWMSEEV